MNQDAGFSQRFENAKDIFMRALDVPAEKQQAFIESECAGDAELLAEVRSLLRHHAQETGSISVHPTTGIPHSAQPEQLPSVPGYRIVRSLGRGGMGMVYLASRESGSFSHRVALKVIKKGMDSDDVIARFENERRVLSAMNHPNIARLFDGGTTEDGRPYFVMEYIEGVPIDEYCDRRRLSIDERLKLFKDVCAAVQYAHANLIVHRDLKPANILVTESGSVKLLDFGIAKLLNPQLPIMLGDPTAPEMRIMTPEYASPEQVRGETITTASDVYSLGVLLYELMTGRRPYQIKMRVREEIERVVCQEEPERPSTAISHISEAPATSTTAVASSKSVTPGTVSSLRNVRPDTLRRRLSGDLDNIILMALRKEPQRRYPSAEKLWDDLDKHLQGLPVSARPSSFGYRSSKFIRRHRAPLAIAASVVIAAIGTLAALLQQKSVEANHLRAEVAEASLLIAERDREAAEAEAMYARNLAKQREDAARALLHELLGRLHTSIEKLDDAIEARQIIAEISLPYLQMLSESREYRDSPELLRELATAWNRRGKLLAGLRTPGVRDTEGALASFAASVELRAAAGPDSPEEQRLLEAESIQLADLLVRSGRYSEADGYYKMAIKLREALLNDNPTARNKLDVSIALNAYGRLLSRLDKRDELRVSYDRSLQLMREVSAESPNHLPLLRELTIAINRRAELHKIEGEFEEAIELYMESLTHRQRIVDEGDENARSRRDLANGHGFLARALLEAQRLDEAEQHAMLYFNASVHGATLTPNDGRLAEDVARASELRGDVAMARGDFEAAHARYEAAEQRFAALSDANPTDLSSAQLVSTAREKVAKALDESQQMAAAIERLRAALDITTRLVEQAPEAVDFQQDLARQQAMLDDMIARASSTP